ncbi:MAG: bifunctional diaminohydroxyphosphoribosylaminopyrimidine deaminase/5-amino-6-(5-phosphoribosylamino)uracil reductase RibD [Actinomycetota bacterium]
MIDDRAFMERAVVNAAPIRHSTSPNPWVGAVVVARDGRVFDGATEPPGGRHAERVALDAAGEAAIGSTVYTTLEPCNHTGRTGPCTHALIDAEVERVVVAVGDPDEQVAGTGIAHLEAAGIEVTVGVGADIAAEQLAPYLHHRRTGRPWVVAKLAASLDGRTAAPDGTSQWITGPEARMDAHRLRAESDAILVGAGTVREDDPSLTVRDWTAPRGTPPATDPRRVVLGTAVANARVQPCLSWDGPLDRLLEQLGSDGVVQLMVEGGARVIGDFHRAGLIDRFVLYQAPVLFGGDDAKGMFTGAGAPSITAVDRGEIVSIARVGDDLRIEFKPGR